MTEEKEKANIIKEALKIIDKLGAIYPIEKGDFEELEELAEKARKLKRNIHWKLE